MVAYKAVRNNEKVVIKEIVSNVKEELNMKNVKNKKMMAVVLPEDASTEIVATASMLTGVTGETARYTAFARKAGHTAIIARVTGTAVPTMRNADNEKGRKNYDGCIVHVCPLGMGRMDLVEGH